MANPLSYSPSQSTQSVVSHASYSTPLASETTAFASALASIRATAEIPNPASEENDPIHIQATSRFNFLIPKGIREVARRIKSIVLRAWNSESRPGHSNTGRARLKQLANPHNTQMMARQLHAAMDAVRDGFSVDVAADKALESEFNQSVSEVISSRNQSANTIFEEETSRIQEHMTLFLAGGGPTNDTGLTNRNYSSAHSYSLAFSLNMRLPSRADVTERQVTLEKIKANLVHQFGDQDLVSIDDQVVETHEKIIKLQKKLHKLELQKSPDKTKISKLIGEVSDLRELFTEQVIKLPPNTRQKRESELKLADIKLKKIAISKKIKMKNADLASLSSSLETLNVIENREKGNLVKLNNAVYLMPTRLASLRQCKNDLNKLKSQERRNPGRDIAQKIKIKQAEITEIESHLASFGPEVLCSSLYAKDTIKNNPPSSMRTKSAIKRLKIARQTSSEIHLSLRGLSNISRESSQFSTENVKSDLAKQVPNHLSNTYLANFSARINSEKGKLYSQLTPITTQLRTAFQYALSEHYPSTEALSPQSFDKAALALVIKNVMKNLKTIQADSDRSVKPLLEQFCNDLSKMHIGECIQLCITYGARET